MKGMRPREVADGNDQPGNLVRAGGWRRDAVKPGDKVEVAFSPLRDAEKRVAP